MSSRRTFGRGGYTRNAITYDESGPVDLDESNEGLSADELAVQVRGEDAVLHGEMVGMREAELDERTRKSRVSKRMQDVVAALRVLGLNSDASMLFEQEKKWTLLTDEERKERLRREALEATRQGVIDRYNQSVEAYQRELDKLYERAATTLTKREIELGAQRPPRARIDMIDEAGNVVGEQWFDTYWDMILEMRKTRSEALTREERKYLLDRMEGAVFERYEDLRDEMAKVRAAYRTLVKTMKPKLTRPQAMRLAALRHKVAVYLQAHIDHVRELSERYDASYKGEVPVADPTGFFYQPHEPQPDKWTPVQLRPGERKTTRIGLPEEDAVARSPTVAVRGRSLSARSRRRSEQVAAALVTETTPEGEQITVVKTAPGGLEAYLRYEVFGLAKDMWIGLDPKTRAALEENASASWLTTLADEARTVAEDAGVDNARLRVDLSDVHADIRAAAVNVAVVARMHMLSVCLACRKPVGAFAAAYPPGPETNWRSKPPSWAHIGRNGGIDSATERSHAAQPVVLLREGQIVWDPQAGWPVSRSDFGLADLRGAVKLLERAFRVITQILLAFSESSTSVAVAKAQADRLLASIAPVPELPAHLDEPYSYAEMMARYENERALAQSAREAAAKAAARPVPRFGIEGTATAPFTPNMGGYRECVCGCGGGAFGRAAHCNDCVECGCADAGARGCEAY